MHVNLCLLLTPLTSFFGNAVVITFLISLILLLFELIRYHRRYINLALDPDDPSYMQETAAKNMRIALVTGASSGLGREFARLIDRDEILIDEIWLIARREERLNELKEELTHHCRILPIDLTREDSFSVLKKELDLSKARVGLFVNCAGVGQFGNYQTISSADAARMIDLNCRAAVLLTQTILPYMKAFDRIIQVCSSAAFQPLQQVNVYAASKAFLYHYTRALRTELLPKRIMVTAVCPFWIRDTEFIALASDTEGQPPIRHFPFSVTAHRVAKRGLSASRIGIAASTPGFFALLQRIFTKILPRTVIMYIWELLRRI